jgi:hypothetical protein
MIRSLAVAIALAGIGIALAEDKPKPGPVVAIPLEATDKVSVKSGDWDKPHPIAADDDLKKFITDAPTRKKILESVDFNTHVLLLFAWQGSGGDRVAAKIVEEAPKEVRFTMKAGATDDIRQNVQLFAVAKETRWTAK